MCGCIHAITCMWKSEASPWEAILSLYCMCPRDWTQVVSLGSKHIGLESHFTDLLSCFFLSLFSWVVWVIFKIIYFVPGVVGAHFSFQHLGGRDRCLWIPNWSIRSAVFIVLKALGMCVRTTMRGFLHGCQGFKLISSPLLSRQFTHWATDAALIVL